jgi:hypothetical protein
MPRPVRNVHLQAQVLWMPKKLRNIPQSERVGDADSSDVVSSGDNVSKIIDDYTKEWIELKEATRAASVESLARHRRRGEMLNVAKEMLPRGKFDEWCKRKLGVGHSSRSKYMALAAGWSIYRRALKEILKSEKDRPLFHSLNYALDLIKSPNGLARPAKSAKILNVKTNAKSKRSSKSTKSASTSKWRAAVSALSKFDIFQIEEFRFLLTKSVIERVEQRVKNKTNPRRWEASQRTIYQIARDNGWMVEHMLRDKCRLSRIDSKELSKMVGKTVMKRAAAKGKR